MYQMDDAQNIFTEFTSEIITYMYPDVAKTIDDTIEFIDTSIVTTSEGYNMQFVLETIDTNEFMGCVGLHRVHTRIPEFGIWLKRTLRARDWAELRYITI